MLRCIYHYIELIASINCVASCFAFVFVTCNLISILFLLVCMRYSLLRRGHVICVVNFQRLNFSSSINHVDQVYVCITPIQFNISKSNRNSYCTSVQALEITRLEWKSSTSRKITRSLKCTIGYEWELESAVIRNAGPDNALVLLNEKESNSVVVI